ncbi:DUF2683 family protein [Dyadobacter luticola]|uniref:Uncharacterized protein n=1 Tax=Dyadobacter luticola TaxID=1979387 RepID=A0A5R9KW54_9BACT|nr:DUF2683 family protein [Dyadobacter luticola]TLV00512.1 hypothetical protein FEN17_13570 [Dyadobacter luticola]
METFIVQPKNQYEKRALKAFFKALDLPFKTEQREESLYNPEFVAKITRGDEDVKAGRTTTVTLDEIWK